MTNIGVSCPQKALSLERLIESQFSVGELGEAKYLRYEIQIPSHIQQATRTRPGYCTVPLFSSIHMYLVFVSWVLGGQDLLLGCDIFSAVPKLVK